MGKLATEEQRARHREQQKAYIARRNGLPLTELQRQARQAATQRWHELHRERVAARQRRYAESHPEIIRAQRKRSNDRMRDIRKNDSSEAKKLRDHQRIYAAWYLEQHREKINAKRRARHNEVRDWLDAYKMQAGCADCGYRTNPQALQFDHVIGIKLFAISASDSFPQIEREIAKCVVRCANCHAIRSNVRRPGRRTKQA